VKKTPEEQNKRCTEFLTKTGSEVDHASLEETLWRDTESMDLTWDEVCLKEGQGKPRPSIQKFVSLFSPKCSVKWLHCATSVFVTSLCLAFSDADNEFDFVLMTSACSQYLKDSCKQHTALTGS